MASIITGRMINFTRLHANLSQSSKRGIISDGGGMVKAIEDPKDVSTTNASQNEDMPDPDIPNPYGKERQLCVLCKHKVKLDYKNAQLLSQFVSQFTGQVYGKHVTGLCKKQQAILEKTVYLSQKAGFMPYHYKDIKFIKDPKLFDIGHARKKV